MSDQDRPGLPDDEPVIGGSAPPPPPPARPPTAPPPEDAGRDDPIGGAPLPRPARTPVDPWESQRLRREAYDLRTFSGDGPRAGYYGATRRSPGRTIAVYAFALAALVIGGILIFLLFRVLDEDEGPPPPETEVAEITPEARIQSPVPGERIPLNEARAVIASVMSGEDVVRFELLVSGIFKDQAFAGTVTGENTYAIELTARFEAAGSYDLVVRAYTSSGTVIASDPVRVEVIHAATVTPPTTTTATMRVVNGLRTGPGENYNQAGTLEPGDVVTIICIAANREWLQIERGDGLFVRLDAVEIAAADLERLNACRAVDEPSETPTPPPTVAPTQPPTVEGTETPPPDAPDFIPVNAGLIEGGATLRVTIRNVSTNAFSGSVVIRVQGEEGVPLDFAEQAVNVSMAPNGEAGLNFTVTEPVVEQVSVTVTIDPDNAIPESQEDNNETAFVIPPASDEPILSLTVTIAGGVLSVSISNEGGELSTSDAVLVVSVPRQEIELDVSPLVIPTEESVTIGDISAPRTGDLITITLVIDGIDVASAEVPNPNTVEPTPEDQTETEPETEPETEADPDDQPEATPDPDQPPPPDDPEPPTESEDE